MSSKPAYTISDQIELLKDRGMLLHSELSSWLITYVRNITAHHSRLWSRNMVKKPVVNLRNPLGLWFDNPLKEAQTKKPFLIISCMIYLCNHIIPNHHIKSDILDLFNKNPSIQIYKMGFLNNWKNEPLWR